MDSLFDIGRFILRKLFCLVLNSTCSSLFGIIIPKGLGSTWTASNLEDSKSNGMVIDLISAVNLSLTQEQSDRLKKASDSGQQSTYNAIFYPLCKSYVDELRRSFNRKRITLVCSDHLLLKYCGVKELNYFVPSSSFLHQILSRMDDIQTVELIRRSVTDLLSQKGQKSLVFSSFDELTSMLKDLGLKAKI